MRGDTQGGEGDAGTRSARIDDADMTAAIDTRALVDWLVDGARDCPLPQAVLQKLCDGLLAAGLPLHRVAVFVRTLHPQIAGRRFLWRAGAEVEVGELKYEAMEASDYIDSPVAYIYRKDEEIRRPLRRADCPMDFAVLGDLRAEGVTDYFGTPLRFTFGEIHVATWTTRDPAGFGEAWLDAIRSIVAPLARVAEVRALTRSSASLLSAYVGAKTAERVRAGQVRRGDTQAIGAAIWLSDMRGFTALADGSPPHEVLEVLNRYFDCQVPAIAARGGEVLKFMGDGLLAIFPVTPEMDANRACGEALGAAREARARVAAVPGMRFGLALHLGDVLYGNIGSGARLDFTCIGPAVNLAARLEKIASQLGRSVVASREFAAQAPGAFVPLGEFALAGFHEPQPAFGLVDD
jgi:adenylate cyclase